MKIWHFLFRKSKGRTQPGAVYRAKGGRSIVGAKPVSVAQPAMEETEEKKGIQPKKTALFIAVFGVVVVGVWFLTSKASKPEQPLPWQACLLKKSDGSPEFSLISVPAGTYQLTSNVSGLSLFLERHQLSKVILEYPLLVQSQEVSRSLFALYADFVNTLPDGEEKMRLLARLGLLWNREASNSPSVQGVSWEAAWDFSNWLSQNTGCDYNIPSREEWSAVIIHLYQSGEKVPQPSDGFSQGPLKNLLRGVREWTRSTCDMGHYLVGEDDWVAEANANESVCMPTYFSVAGFRVVLNPSKLPTNNQTKPTHPDPN